VGSGGVKSGAMPRCGFEAEGVRERQGLPSDEESVAQKRV
jgi:hypothetical protein